jgi:hypothetical protein
MRWRQPTRTEGRLWLAQFNEALHDWVQAGFPDDDQPSRALAALRALLDREPDCADLVSGLAVTLLFQGQDSLPAARGVEAAELGLRAERMRVDDDGERSLQRTYLLNAKARIRLGDHETFTGLDEAAEAAHIVNKPGQEGPLVDYLRAWTAVTEADGWDALLEPDRALDGYHAAFDLVGPFVSGDDHLLRLLVEVVTFLYGDSEEHPDELVQATLRSIWHALASMRVNSAIGIARCKAILRSDDADESARAVADAIARFGPGASDAALFTPIVRNIDLASTRAVVNAVVEQAGALRLDSHPYLAVLCAVSSAKLAEDGGDPAELLTEAQVSRENVADRLAIAASLGWAFVAEAKCESSTMLEPQGVQPFVLAMERLVETEDERLRDLRILASLDEPLAYAIDQLTKAFERDGDTATRIHLARLLDGVRGARPPFVALLRGAKAVDDIEAGRHALDRLGRLEAALRTWPEAACVIQREGGSGTIFICISADTPPFVVRADAAWREAARALGSELQAQAAELDLVGTPGPAAGMERAGRTAFETLPQPLQQFIAAHRVLLLCPDYRTNGDSIPYELFHDGSDWLGITKVLARYPSLRAMTRSVEGTALRVQERRALAVAVPHAEGFDDLRFAAEEADWVQQRLADDDWDAPVIATDRVSAAFLLQRLPFASHIHVAAHGDATGRDEAIVCVDGERLHTDDLLRRFFPRMPTVYLNTCDLATTRYVGAGVSRGLALAMTEQGAGAVVANLLPVDDAFSSQLAQAFYASESPFGEALRLARSSLASSGVSPLFWSTTVLLGDPRTTLRPSRPTPTLAGRLLNAYFEAPGEVDETAILEAARALATGQEDPRLTAAVSLVRDVASWDDVPERATLAASLQIALTLDHLPTAAMIAFMIVDSMDDEAEHDLASRAIAETLALLEPLEAEGGVWKRLLDRLLARWAELQRGEGRLEGRVSGPGSPEEHQEMTEIGRALTDAQLAVAARAMRRGEAPGPRNEQSAADVCWNAILAGGGIDLDDTQAAFAYARQTVQRLVSVGGLSEEIASLATTAIAGFLMWSWSRQPAADLPAEMAEGQSSTLGIVVQSLGEHWPPMPADWFATVEPFREETASALATLEGLPYDDSLYPRIDEVISGIHARADELLEHVRVDHPDRLPDAATWILGTLVERNTYSWTDGSVPEDISERLRGVFFSIASPGDDLFIPWLMEGFKSVREREMDELDRWKYGIGDAQAEDTEADRADYEDAESDDSHEHPSYESVARIPRGEREATIRELLEEVAEDTADGLPEGLIAAVVDESYLPVIERGLDPAAPLVVQSNAVRTIGLLADWQWDHREIASPDTSIPRLLSLYEATEVRRIRQEIVQTVFKFDPTDLPIEFVLDRLALDHQAVKGAILSEMQFVVDRPYLRDLVNDRLLPMLHEFCEYPLSQSVYRDDLFGESDFRFWVFRCIRTIGNPESVPVIERYMESTNWPLEALVEAAHAHWALTGVPTYLEVLRRAKREDALGNAETALKEMEKFVRAEARKKKASSEQPEKRP